MPTIGEEETHKTLLNESVQNFQTERDPHCYAGFKPGHPLFD